MPGRHPARIDARQDPGGLATTSRGLGQRLPRPFVVEEFDQPGGRRQSHVTVDGDVHRQVHQHLGGLGAVQARHLPHGLFADVHLPPLVGGDDHQRLGGLGGRQFVDDAGGGQHRGRGEVGVQHGQKIRQRPLHRG